MSDLIKPTDVYHEAVRLAEEYTKNKIPNAHDIVIAHVRINSIRVMVEFVYKSLTAQYHTGTIEFGDDLKITGGYLSSENIKRHKKGDTHG